MLLRSPRCFPQARQAELEAARLAKEKEDEEAKLAAQQAKKEKEIQKKAIKKERQKLRTTCKVSFHGSQEGKCVGEFLDVFSFCICPHAQNWNYFAQNEADGVKMMEEVEKLCDRLELTR